MKAIVVYWTGTGNTEIMAQNIKEGLEESGYETQLKFVTDVDVNELADFDKIALGCPSMGIEELEEEDFEPFFENALKVLSNKKVALFGSFGWGEGEWMDTWEQRCIKAGVNLFESGIKINSTPSSKELLECREFAVRFAKF